MGIVGSSKLLTALRWVMQRMAAPSKQNLYGPKFQGWRIGMDCHMLLHKAIQRQGNADALVINERPDYKPVAMAVANWCRQMLKGGLHLHVAFDGPNAPPGKKTKHKRAAEARDKLKEVCDSVESGLVPAPADVVKAASCFVDAAMVEAVRLALREVATEFPAGRLQVFVAPFEADSQLTHWAKTGVVNAVLTVRSISSVHPSAPGFALLPRYVRY